jgi:hypothetical protein
MHPKQFLYMVEEEEGRNEERVRKKRGERGRRKGEREVGSPHS